MTESPVRTGAPDAPLDVGRGRGRGPYRRLALPVVLVLALLIWLFAPGGPLDPRAPEVLWSSSFDPPPGTTWEQESGVVAPSRTNARLVEKGPDGREDVLEITFGEDGSRWGMDYRHSFQDMGVEPGDEVWFAYDVYFPEDFEFIGDGKFGGLSGAVEGLSPLDVSSGGSYDERSFSVRTMWKEDRGVVMYLYARHADGRDILDPRNYGYGIAVPFRNPDGTTSGVLRPGSWQRVEHRVTLNSPGSSDGVYELWVDGHRGVRLTDVQYRTAAHPELSVNQLFSAWFFGGSEDQYPTRVNVAYTDDWVLRRP